MNGRFLIVTLTLLLASAPSWAQRKKATGRKPAKAVVMPQEDIDSLLRIYRFDVADSALQNNITLKQKRKEATLLEEQQLAHARKGMRMLSAVERVVVFDSLIVPASRVLESMALSQESGRILRSKDKGLSDDPESTLFLNELGDQIIFAQADTSGTNRLYSADIVDQKAGNQRRLDELDEDGTSELNYPFMQADGQTLYFARQSEDGLGGYDIFMTRYDADEKHFLIPENIGMPFNSPANDYFYCVDETYNIGCFATDRNTTGDSVAIYYFIPNTARRVYNEVEVGNEALRQLARLTNLQLTWGEQNQVKAARARLAQCRDEQGEAAGKKPTFTLWVADNRAIHSTDELTSDEARKAVQQWVDKKEELSRLEAQLESARNRYAQAATNERTSMKSDILAMEQNQEMLTLEVRKLKRLAQKTVLEQ